MATHDKAAGTGGLDASIIFELDRAENIGRAFNNSFGFFNNYYSIKASASDLLALGVAVSSGICGGLKIPLRGGRIDATEAGPPGVPEPQHDLQSISNAFTKAGFNRKDMIAMVACGHTLGGIHSMDFPEITGGDSSPENDTVSHFDGTFDNFDNRIATEYLNGITENPLVVGLNDTLNSDKRVFGADGNETMIAMADPAAFKSMCEDIFTRMIDTVPSAVTLGEPIDAADIKPYISTLALNNDGNITFEGRVRVRITSGTGRNPNDLALNITFADRNGIETMTPIFTKRATFQSGLSAGLHGEGFVWFEFNTVLNPNFGISKFNIHLLTLSTRNTIIYDNSGGGFPIQDTLLFQQAHSCLDTTIIDGKMALTITAAVLKSQATDPLELRLVHRVPREGVIVPKLELETIQFSESATGEQSGYVFRRTQTKLASETWSTTFDIALGSGQGEQLVEFLKTSALTTNVCAAS
jgi:hypothetical protein